MKCYKSSWALSAWEIGFFTAGLVRAFNMVVMYIVYLHQTYLLTLESISWDNILEYPLEHLGCGTEFLWEL